MKNRVTGIVLILEIAVICILHAVKIHQSDIHTHNSASKPLTPHQKDVFLRQMAFNNF